MQQSVAGAARASRMPLSHAWYANARASCSTAQEMQAMQCKKQCSNLHMVARSRWLR